MNNGILCDPMEEAKDTNKARVYICLLYVHSQYSRERKLDLQKK